MFGMAIEDDITHATDKAKDKAQAERKAALVLNKWMTMPVEEEAANVQGRSKFRDPAEKFGKSASRPVGKS